MARTVKLTTKGTQVMLRTPGQRERFVEAARALECDDHKDRFEKRLGKIAKAKPRDGKK